MIKIVFLWMRLSEAIAEDNSATKAVETSTVYGLVCSRFLRSKQMQDQF